MIARKFSFAVVLIVFMLILASCGGGATSTSTAVPPTQPPATEIPTDAPTEEVATEESPTEASPTEESSTEASSTEEAVAGQAESEASADGVMITVVQENTALRGGPGTSYEVITRVTVNDTFPVVAQYGEGRNLWYQITLADGTSAWAWSRVVTLNPADAVVPVAEDVPPAPAS